MGPTLTVRSVEMRKKWLALGSVQHPLVPKQVHLSDELGLLPDDLDLRSPITVLAGLNGVGKTRLLRLLNEALGDDSRLISLHELCSWVTHFAKDRTDLAEIPNESEELQVDELTLDAVRSVVGRNYDSVHWYAADVADSPFEDLVEDQVVPYFSVTDGDDCYEMKDMGLGELAAHLLLWLLWYLRDEEIFLLLDEPDAFFPPSSREPLIDFLGAMALRRDQAFVITTHSRELIERGLMHDSVLTYLNRTSDRVAVLGDRVDVREIVERILYPEDNFSVIAWVEDDSAHAFANALLRNLDPMLARQSVIFWTTGTGDLDALRNHLPRPARSLKSLEFAFIWDGDQEPDPSPVGRWPALTLPGGFSPDELFKLLAPQELELLSSGLGLSPAFVEAALGKIAAWDAHDWTAELVRLSSNDRPMTLKVLAEAAISAQPELVTQFRETLRGANLDAFSGLAEP